MGFQPVTVTRSFEPHRNLITAIDNSVDATLISRYAYDNNVDWSAYPFG